mmetsp:Transcript_16176/g.18909  ORF Transcript_16176/g.18909 Transcript_16176/m.18909 type:complete len:185 (-) Transcript_16176:1327-1881(-)
MGWMTPPNMVMLKSLRRPTDREKSIREQVWQDAGFPAERLTESVNKSHDLFEIYPLLCYPCKIIDNGGMVRSPENHGKEFKDTQSKTYLNLGIYGTPKGIRQSTDFKTLHSIREWESFVRSVGGFQHTYCDSMQTEEEFREMFDHSLWEKMREKYECNTAFNTVYEKTRPEVDVWKWLEEEEHW